MGLYHNTKKRNSGKKPEFLPLGGWEFNGVKTNPGILIILLKWIRSFLISWIFPIILTIIIPLVIVAVMSGILGSLILE